jgi:hypothetical protein
MAQHRYWDFGSPIPQDADNLVNRALNAAGVYEGFDLTADSSGNLILNVGIGLQPDGIIWAETSTRLFAFSPPGVAENYTLIATHEDESRIGGSEVEYDLVTGLLTSVTDGIPLGWIFHPGGGSTLTQGMIQSVYKTKPKFYSDTIVSLSPRILTPAFESAYHDVAASGANTSLDPRTYTTSGLFLVYQEASNDALAPSDEQVVQHITSLIDNSQRPYTVDLYVNIPNSPNNALITQVYGTDQVLVPIASGGTINNTSGWEHKTIEIERDIGTWDTGSPWELRFLFNLDPGQSIGLGRIKINYWPYA